MFACQLMVHVICPRTPLMSIEAAASEQISPKETNCPTDIFPMVPFKPCITWWCNRRIFRPSAKSTTTKLFRELSKDRSDGSSFLSSYDGLEEEKRKSMCRSGSIGEMVDSHRIHWVIVKSKFAFKTLCTSSSLRRHVGPFQIQLSDKGRTMACLIAG
uniref:Uncharacterized protein n=1 Tax=Cyclophora tenuis TaxID=216820 RepID=A0A7S1DD26_CYCTE